MSTSGVESLEATPFWSSCSARSWSLLDAICCNRLARRRSSWGVGYVARSRCWWDSRPGLLALDSDVVGDAACPRCLLLDVESVLLARGLLGPASGAPFVASEGAVALLLGGGPANESAIWRELLVRERSEVQIRGTPVRGM